MLVSGLAVFDDGTGEQLYAEGFTYPYPGYAGVPSIARWDGRRWEVINEGLEGAYDLHALSVFEVGMQGQLYVRLTEHLGGRKLMRWHGDRWVEAASGLGGADEWPVFQMPAGAGGDIYGLRAAPNTRNLLLRWDGTGWVLAGTPSNHISAFASFDDGTGPKLHIAGSFTNIDGIPLQNIARWSGQSWEPLGEGIGPGVRQMITHDDGTGEALYVADIQHAGGMPVNRIGRWDGTSWTDVGGGGISSQPITTIHVMASFDDGRGPGLFVGGFLNSTGHGLPLRRIARFDGVQWDNVGGGLGGQYPQAMAVYDDGRGPSLFVGGLIDNAGAGGPGSTWGIAQWVGCRGCYVNCDNSDRSPRLNVDDFMCFINKFAYGDPYVDCNQDGVRDVSDFHCYIARFGQGCG